jgi:hypothetical protein
MKSINHKTFLAIVATVLVAGTAFFTSCEKDETNSVSTTNISKKVKPMSDEMKAFLIGNGIDVEGGVVYTVTYRSGCYNRETVLLGLYEKVSCTPGCDYCELISVLKDGVSVSFSFEQDTSTGEYGLNIDPALEDMHDGLLHISNTQDGPKLFFMIDINKVSNPDLYKENYLTLESPFAINYELAIQLGIKPGNQIIPSGSYKLEKFDNIAIWSVPLDGLLTESEQENYINLINENSHE